jgi:hypothetical protein
LVEKRVDNQKGRPLWAQYQNIKLALKDKGSGAVPSNSKLKMSARAPNVKNRNDITKHAPIAATIILKNPKS